MDGAQRCVFPAKRRAPAAKQQRCAGLARCAARKVGKRPEGRAVDHAAVLRVLREKARSCYWEAGLREARATRSWRSSEDGPRAVRQNKQQRCGFSAKRRVPAAKLQGILPLRKCFCPGSGCFENKQPQFQRGRAYGFRKTRCSVATLGTKVRRANPHRENPGLRTRESKRTSRHFERSFLRIVGAITQPNRE